MAKDHSEQIRAALLMREGDVSWKEISRRLNVSPNTIRGRCDPEYRRHLNILNAKRKKAIREGNHRPKAIHVVRDNDELRNPLYDPKRDGVRLPQTLTAYLLGDPFEGRDAIMRRAG